MTMGWAFLPSTLLMILCIKLDRALNKSLEFIRKDRGKLEEKLRNATSDTINNIQALKFYGWDEYFEKDILDKNAASGDMANHIEQYHLLFTLMWHFLPSCMNTLGMTLYLGMGHTLDLPTAMEIMATMDQIKGPIHHI